MVELTDEDQEAARGWVASVQEDDESFGHAFSLHSGFVAGHAIQRERAEKAEMLLAESVIKVLGLSGTCTERDHLREEVENWRACFIEMTKVGRALLDNSETDGKARVVLSGGGRGTEEKLEGLRASLAELHGSKSHTDGETK